MSQQKITKVASMAASVSKFIPRTVFPDYRVSLADFKGHHVVAMTKLTQLAPQIDLVLEVRDSRAPISTGNVLLDRPLQGKDKIVLYSKSDLSNLDPQLLKKWHRSESEYMIFNSNSDRDKKKLLQLCKQKHAEMYPPPPLGLRMIVTGMPNVGKSVIVNNLRRLGMGGKRNGYGKNVARTGGQPGVTRSTSEVIWISKSPSIYVYDTPGVSLPQAKNSETMITLALVGAVKPTKVDPVIVADYLLYVLNLQDPTGGLYSDYLKDPTNDISVLLRAIAIKLKKYRYVDKKIVVDETGTAIHWVDKWRQGRTKKKVVFEAAAIPGATEANESKDFLEQRFVDEKERVNRMDIDLNRTGKSSINARRAFKQKRADRANLLFR
ncbi:unnamed protein product [Kuraishia capsulata CBS 1993]|uniref:G domain-containing protein n=1 Tax=Kuraishia capsulata CBS 1993 TaxID=1382522 RepID=W6MWD4_9ASCO|nr:uncharacterized protein KUCA_T00003228001 [Kuraishia capsulata CBS 1993]CDK27250.1 unnamed protein product [Kuraishia capsulata CBS 1993]